MQDEVFEIQVSETPATDEVADIEGLAQDHRDGSETAALVAEMFGAVLAVVAANATAGGPTSRILARDRVLIPEVRVGHVVDVVEALRPRLLGAAAGMFGAGADRLKSVQDAIGSRIDKRS